MTELVYQEGPVTLYRGDCREVMRLLAADSIDSIVTDPPYELGFMGRKWDSSGIAYDPDVWAQAYRVLKPGGHALVFGGTRTWHRVAVALEDAWFEIRDSLAWMYGSGFPKSMDVSSAIDKGSGGNRARQLEFTAWMRSTGITSATIYKATGTHMSSHYLTDGQQPAIATADLFDKLRPYLPEVPEAIERLVAERTGIEWTDYVNRPVTGQHVKEAAAQIMRANLDGGTPSPPKERRDVAHSPEAQKWQGWGTALKPAFEPVIVARKPLIGTVAANVLAHGTGAINIAANRIGAEQRVNPSGSTRPRVAMGDGWRADAEPTTATGRWPSNVLLDPSQAAALDEQTGTLSSGISPNPVALDTYGDTGGASRFFYCAKAPSSERPNIDGVQHATVKPLDVMRWLVRLVTPPGGVVLEPFAGSGTTLEAAVREGFDVIGAELDDDGTHIPLIRQRLAKDHQLTLFGDL